MRNKVQFEYVLDDLGFFSVSECEAIKQKCDGTSMNIHVKWSNWAGNCTIILASDYRTEEDDFLSNVDDVRKEVVSMFLHKALSELKRW